MRIATRTDQRKSPALSEKATFEIIGYFRDSGTKFTYMIEARCPQEAVVELIRITKEYTVEEIAHTLRKHRVSILRLASWEEIEIVSLRLQPVELLHRMEYRLPEPFGHDQDVEMLIERTIANIKEAYEKLEVANRIIDPVDEEEALHRARQSGRHGEPTAEDYSFAGPTANRLRRLGLILQSSIAELKKEV